MSYKTKLQTNNDNLEGNNIDLQSILNTINNLPAAGGGGAEIDTCTVEFESDTRCNVYLTTIENSASSLSEYEIANYVGLIQENVLCNSLALISSNIAGGEITNILVDGEIANTLYRSLEYGIIIIPSKKNETVVVSISNPV